MAGRYHALQDRYRRLHTDSQLPEIVQDLQDITREAASLTSDVASLRSRGYVHAAYLERKSALLYEHWQAALGDIQPVLDIRVTALRHEFKQFEVHNAQLSQHSDNISAMDDLLPSAEAAAAALENKIHTAEIYIRQMYAVLERDINQTIEQIQEIHWLLDQRDQSNIVLQPGESLFMGIAASVSFVSANSADGVLYLTNQRFLFEPKSADINQALIWGIDLAQVQEVKAQRIGMVDGADSLSISYLRQDEPGRVTAAIRGWAKCKLWAAHIQRLCFGDASDERAIPLDDEFLAVSHGAPASCHVCGAALLSSGAANSQRLLCTYCGAIVSW